MIYDVVWIVVAISLVVLDWQFWRGPAPATVQPVHMQNAAFFEWAMLDLNQRPPPCKGGKGRF